MHGMGDVDALHSPQRGCFEYYNIAMKIFRKWMYQTLPPHDIQMKNTQKIHSIQITIFHIDILLLLKCICDIAIMQFLRKACNKNEPVTPIPILAPKQKIIAQTKNKRRKKQILLLKFNHSAFALHFEQIISSRPRQPYI